MRRQVKFAPTASSSKKTTPPPRKSRSLPVTPSKRVRTFSSISTTIRKRLRKIDSGRCLITQEKWSSASRQAAHIVARKTKPSMVTALEKMWKQVPLNLDSTKNLVTLRSDWHLSYDNGDWAFVPSEGILKAILNEEDHTFRNPYPHFDPNALREYEFVPFPTLRRKKIVREIVKDEDEDDGDEEEDEDDEDDEDEDDLIEFKDEDEGKRKATAKGKGKATVKVEKKAEAEAEADNENDEDGNDENDDDGDGTTDVFGTATAYRTPFLGFPILNHHAHPFYVIDNALPKLQANKGDLRPEHLTLLNLMVHIQAMWTGRLSKKTTQKLAKRRKPNDDDDTDTNDNDKDDNGTDKDISKRRTRSMTQKKQSSSKLPSTSQAKASGGTGKTRRHKTAPASRSSNLGTSYTKAFLYDQPSEITAWSAEVAADGSDFRMDDTVSWSDDEPVRPPINNWDKWHVPYSQPRKYADFCSSDWPMYFYSYALWMPSNT